MKKRKADFLDIVYKKRMMKLYNLSNTGNLQEKDWGKKRENVFRLLHFKKILVQSNM